MSRLYRSLLFVPGLRPDRFAKAEAAGADAVVFDLEDSVSDARKAEARREIAAWLSTPATGSTARVVRVNASSTPVFQDDLDWLADVPAPDAIMLPKAEDAWSVDRLGAAAPHSEVIPLIETARGVLNAFAITGARPPFAAFAFGGEDLTAQLGVARTIDGEELLFARSQVALAAATAGVPAIDGVLIDIEKHDLLRRDAERARALGYQGKLAIHPSQVPVINDVFSPTAQEIAAARRIVDAARDAAAQGEAVIRLDDRMVDAPIVARATRLLDLAARIDARARSDR